MQRVRDGTLEDAVLHEAGRNARATGVVTRNAKGFAPSTRTVYAPDESLRLVEALPAG